MDITEIKSSLAQGLSRTLVRKDDCKDVWVI